MYEIATEYDGREVAVIKSSIQYQVAIAGIIKKSKPDFSEIENLLTEAPNHTGIWIDNSSRNKFLEILKNITNAEYNIDNDGFLTQTEKIGMNKVDKAIKKMLESPKLYVFNISSKTYLVDEVTGQTQEYPFEEMDPYIPYEYFESDNKSLYVITTNSLGKLNYDDVFKEIFENIET